MIQYVTLEMCVRELFPYIHRKLAEEESAADYQSETNGMAELQKVLDLVQYNEYYATLEEKAPYLICSIAGSQYFSNGNKRLSVVMLLQFIGLNNRPVRTFSAADFQTLLVFSFPEYQWEPNKNLDDSYALFLYNLAIVIGDRPQWGTNDFSEVKRRVAEMFSILYQV